MLEWINQYVFGWAVPIGLLAVGVYFFVWLRFFPMRRIREILRTFFRGAKRGKDSPLRALCLALAGTLGVGNIVGVSSAIYLGGFGAIFWMWVSALLSMILKYAEIVLAVKHRRKGSDGFFGGAPYYIKDIFSSRGMAKTGSALAAVFAVLCMADALFMGCMIQAEAVSGALYEVAQIPRAVVGLFLGVFCFWLLLRGSRGVTAVTDRLVPMMSVGYVIVSLFCIVTRWDELPLVWERIFRDAFCADSAAGGLLGFFLSRALRFGSMRGLLSNEAGCGTSPMAHAAAETDSAAEQGFFGLAEVFVDTILLCSMTAFVILLNYDAALPRGESPMLMTLAAYSASFSGFAATLVEAFLAVSVLFFGLATLLCWGHYGLASLGFLTKHGRLWFILVYAVFAVVGAAAMPSGIWGAADLAIGSMTLINLVTLILGRQEIRQETALYFSFFPKRRKKTKK